MLDVIDALLNLLEPGGAMDAETALRTATSGTTVDHTAARPYQVEFQPNTLYAWPGPDRHVVTEAGNPPSEREEFTLELLYCATSSSEQAKSQALRAVSAVVDAKAHAYMAVVAANKAPSSNPDAPWSELRGEINPDTIRGFNVRGVGLRLTGWRQLHD